MRLQEGLEGGALMDVGCYAVNCARYLFGAEPLEVVALQRRDPAGERRHRLRRHPALPRRPPGPDRRQLRRLGHPALRGGRAGGTIRVERAFLPGDGRATVRINVQGGGQGRAEEIAGADQYALEADHFARSVRAGRSPRRRRTASCRPP